MSSRTLRRMIFSVHKWLGLHIAIFFGIIFLTGTVLVFAVEIEAVFIPEIWAAQPEDGDRATFGEIYETAQSAMVGAKVTIITKQPKPGIADRSIVAKNGKRFAVWTDPENAKLLRITSDRNFRSILLEFHDSLMIPNRIGFLLVTSTSLILLTSVVAGFISYRRFWKGLFRLPNRGGDTRSYWAAMHRVVGLWSAPFLLLVGLTGLFFFTTGLGFKGYVPRLPAATERAHARPANMGTAMIDQAEQIALAASPGFEPDTVKLPAIRRDGIRFLGQAGHSKIFGDTVVSVDPENLRVLGIIRPDQKRGIAWLSPIVGALHFGKWGGNITRAIWVLFGLASTLLIFAGVKIYLARLVRDQARGSWVLFWRGLGVFRWLYLASILGVAAVSIIRFAL